MVVVALLLMLGPICIGQQITHEEQVVRAAYGKLSYGAQLGVLWHAVAQHDGWPGLDDGLTLSKAMNEELRFELSGFKVGNIRELGTASWTSLVEGPVDVIQINSQETPVTINKDKFSIVYADVGWKKSPGTPIERNEDPSMRTTKSPTVLETIKALKKPTGGGEWARYASYSVVAMLRDRSISYRATFLFANGKSEEALPLDYALTSGVALFINSPMYPEALVNTAFREIPFVQAWIASNEVSGCKKLHEPEVCCVPTTGQCGLAAEDVQRSMALPIDPESRWLVSSRMHTEDKKGSKK